MNDPWNEAVADAIRDLPEVLQGSVGLWFERLRLDENGQGFPLANVALLARLVAVSEFAAGVIAKEWRQICMDSDCLCTVPSDSELELFVAGIADSDEPLDSVQQRLRQYRNRYLLAVLCREVQRSTGLAETSVALSALADRLLDAAAQYATQQVESRYGAVRDRDGNKVSIVILGMGKLGGGELNFSSDIDIIFLNPGGGDSDGPRSVSAAEYFTRVSQQIVALLDVITSDGFVFRIDTRLRPFGDSGPPVVSFAALEAYLLQHGRGWERYAYVKARIVGPLPPQSVADDLNQSMISPFVYRRYLDFGVFESLRDMQALIATEVQRKEMADNIKLGPGGIREIEFIVQSMQLVRGGRRPDLQGQNLLEILPRLVGRRGLSQRDADELQEAYCFLRRVENFIQAIRDRQDHEIPRNEADRARLCVAMNYPDWDAFISDLNGYRGSVSRQFGKVAFRRPKDAAGADRKTRLIECWDATAAADEWAKTLDKEGFPNAQELGRILAAFAGSRATQRIDEISRQRLREFMGYLLVLIRDRQNPALALQRTVAIVAGILRRSAYIALLNENAQAMQHLVSLVDKSGYIADQIARYPMLLDELLDPRVYTARITRSDLEYELHQYLGAEPDSDSELQMETLAQFQRASQFRIAVADFNGNLPIMRVSDSLTDLAETVLAYALQVAWRDMTDRYGVPRFRVGEDTHQAGFGIVAYGKFGGIELSYGSDLDLVFLHDSRGSKQVTDGDKSLDNTMFFTRLVRRLVHFLTTQTGSGALYEIDTRLRPDGQSGLLVTNIAAYERYQEENAWTWEHQALLRARPVAGSAIVAREFERIRVETLTTRVRRDSLQGDVTKMRKRMRQELDRSDESRFDLKQGRGGIADLEFIVQYLVLANAAEHPAVIHYPDNIRQLATLAAAGCIEESVAEQLQAVYRAYRLRLHHLSLDAKPPVVPIDEFGTERNYVVKTWQKLFNDT